MNAPQFLLNELEGRNALAKLIIIACEEAGATVINNTANDDITLEIKGTGLSATVKIWKGLTGPLTIGWHGAKQQLRAVQKAFEANNIHQPLGLEATRPCDSQAHLIEALVIGLNAAKSGRAFDHVNVE